MIFTCFDRFIQQNRKQKHIDKNYKKNMAFTLIETSDLNAMPFGIRITNNISKKGE